MENKTEKDKKKKKSWESCRANGNAVFKVNEKCLG